MFEFFAKNPLLTHDLIIVTIGISIFFWKKLSKQTNHCNQSTHYNLTTHSTIIRLLPTTMKIGGYDSILAEIILAIRRRLLLGALTILLFIRCLYSINLDLNFLTYEAT